MAFDFDAGVDYANRFWFRPCEDNLVVTHARMVNVQHEMRIRHLRDSEWEPGFYFYSAGASRREGLFVVSKSFLPTVTQRITNNFSIDSVPDPRHFLISWPDSSIDEAIGQRPPFTGLNDCTHFVTECLHKSKVPHIQCTSPQELFGRLRKMGQTKTLALMTSVDKAKRIINVAGVPKIGDVLLFATEKRKHGHCGFYLGERNIAQHTHLNHADSKMDRTTEGKSTDNWQTSASPPHQLVTIVHFSRSDDIVAGSSVPGWWTVAQGATSAARFFDKTGGVGKAAKAGRAHPSPGSLTEKGYWFQTAHEVIVCWPQTGDCEIYSSVSPGASTMNGEVNGGVRVVATRV